MSASSIIAILVTVLVLILSVKGFDTGPDHSGSNSDYCDVSDAPQNPSAREDWWQQVHGPPPTAEQLSRTHQVINRQLSVRKQGAYRDAGINGWDDLGPKNIGGRIRAIAIHPDNADEIYIGGVAGGVWKSNDAGVNWNEITPSVLAYPVTSIAINPVNPDILYATTGEYSGSNHMPGVGVLKSIDGGSNWTVTNAPDTNFLWLAKIVINPLDPDILFVVGSTADSTQANSTNNPSANPSNDRRAVFRSNDAGNTWTQVFGGGMTPGHIWDIEFNPSDTSELVIGTLYRAFISDSSGQIGSWSSLMGAAPLITTAANYNRGRCELAYCENSPSTIYLLRYMVGTGVNAGTTVSELWQTTDGGMNWDTLVTTTGGANVNILGTQGNYDNALWVDPANCNQAIMGGINLFKWVAPTLTRISDWTNDINGNNATGDNSSVHADQHIIVPDPNYDGSSNTRVYIGNDGGIYKSNSIWSATLNSGWAALNNEINITQLFGVDVSITGETLIGGSQDNSYFVNHSGNGGGQHWDVYSTGDGAHSAIKKSDPEIMYTSLQNGRIFKSEDGGDTFCRAMTLDSTVGGLQCDSFSVFDDNPLFIAPLEMDPNDDTRIYVAGERLFKTEDEGISWQIAKSDVSSNRRISTIEIAIGDEDLIWVGYDNGTVSKSTDGGANWIKVDTGGIGLPNAYITDIAINKNNHDEVMVTLGSGFSQNVVYHTADAGSTWNNRSPDFDILAYSVSWHPAYQNWVYIGTPLGIFASENNGVDWSITPLYNQSEGPVYTPVVELVWQGDGSTEHPYYLVAATHGRGAWRTRFPIRSKYYVDMNCNPCGLGSFAEPYATFKEALAAAGSGSEIIFLSGGSYDEIPAAILIKKRIKVTLHATVATSVVIE